MNYKNKKRNNSNNNKHDFIHKIYCGALITAIVSCTMLSSITANADSNSILLGNYIIETEANALQQSVENMVDLSNQIDSSLFGNSILGETINTTTSTIAALNLEEVSPEEDIPETERESSHVIEINTEETESVDETEASNEDQITGPASEINNEDSPEEEIVEYGPGTADYTSYEECEPYTMYIANTYVNIRSEARVTDDNIVDVAPPKTDIIVVGYSVHDSNWYMIQYNENLGFMYNENIVAEKPSTYNETWSGEKLNKRNGRVKGPSGNETYYNLPMKKVIYYMNQLGYYGEVWVREDGVKMFGDYVMVAANLKIRPKGSLVETTLGTGIVVDTGSFVKRDSTGLDIAVSW